MLTDELHGLFSLLNTMEMKTWSDLRLVEREGSKVEMGISLNFWQKSLKREEHVEDLCKEVRKILQGI